MAKLPSRYVWVVEDAAGETQYLQRFASVKIALEAIVERGAAVRMHRLGSHRYYTVSTYETGAGKRAALTHVTRMTKKHATDKMVNAELPWEEPVRLPSELVTRVGV